MGQDADLDNKGVIFPDYFSFAVFKTMVSGKIDIHTYFHEQSAVGGSDLFYGSLFLKNIETLIDRNKLGEIL
ncbi:MAG: hypothetical protein JRJ74_12570 [Deltaproteobacteria bacterium]|nr:hypothetical protein [Deltaproteobacteria bacterium]